MYSLSHLLSVAYWFSEPPFLGAPALWTMVIVFGLMVIGGIVFYSLSQNHDIDKFLRRGYKKLAKMLVWMGIIAYLLLFFRYEFAAVLARRVVFGLWLIGLIVWIVFAVKYFVRQMPELRKKLEEQERLQKYLP